MMHAEKKQKYWSCFNIQLVDNDRIRWRNF